MLGIFVMAGCVLMTCAGPPIGGYSSGSGSGSGRGLQEYRRVYRSRGFAGTKNPYSDLGEQLGSSSYAGAGTHRYSIAGGVPTAGSSYSSDSGYSDAGNSHSSGFGGHPSGVNTEALSGASSSSYSSIKEPPNVQSPEIGVSSYAAVSTSPGLGGYTAGGSTQQQAANQGGSTYAEYSEEPGSHGSSSLGGLTGGERSHAAEYSTASHPSPSYITTYSHGGAKPLSYTASGSNNRGHGGTSYSSNPTISFMSGGHHGGSSGSSYYPSEGSSHAGISSGPGYSSGPSLSSILTGMHNGAYPSNYLHGSSGGHRPSSPNHIYATASNQNPSYSSRGPSSGYFSSSPYSRGGGKIILVKESSGGSGGHVGHMYPGEQHSYNGGIFGGASRGYKLRSVASGPNSYGPSVASGYASSGGYPVNSGHPTTNHGGGGFFGFL